MNCVIPVNPFCSHVNNWIYNCFNLLWRYDSHVLAVVVAVAVAVAVASIAIVAVAVAVAVVTCHCVVILLCT